MKTRALRLFLSVPLLLLLTAAAPKRTDIPSLGETIEVSIVNVDVVVTDKDGRRVRGLTKDDFVIVENDKPRAISNFAEYASEDATVSGASEARQAPAQKRNVAIFIERANLLPHNAHELVESLRRAVRGAVREGDGVSLILWSPWAHARIDLSGKPQEADRVLAALEKDLAGPPDRPLQHVQADLADVRAFTATLAGEGVNGLEESEHHSTVIGTLQELRAIERKVRAINAVINGLAAEDGKKILLLAAHRLGEVAGREFFYSVQPVPRAQDRSRYNARALIDTIIANANAAAVTVYPVYPSGVLNRVDRSGGAYVTMVNEMQSLARIARETGGLEASGTSELAAMIERVQDDLTDYYSLAYRLDGTRADRKRELAVKTKNPAYRVRARRSYVEKSDETRMKDRLMMALFRAPGESMFPIEATLGDAKRRKRTTGTAPLRVRIPVHALTVVPENGSSVGAFSVFVVAGSPGDDLSDVARQTQRFEIPRRDLGKATSSHFTYDLEVVLRNDTDRLAIGVLDEVSKSYAVLRLPVENVP